MNTINTAIKESPTFSTEEFSQIILQIPFTFRFFVVFNIKVASENVFGVHKHISVLFIPKKHTIFLVSSR